MRDVGGRGEVERAGELRGDAQRVADRSRSIFANDAVERIGGDVILNEEGGHAADAGRERHGQGRMGELGRDQTLEFSDELMTTFRRQIEFEQFDGDEAFAGRVIRTKDGS